LYEQEAQRRVDMERENKEYTFAPLKVSLQNMHKLTGHMLENKQFPQPLAGDERRVLARFQGHIKNLVALQAPYKRTVKLALLMGILQEIITVRHVINPLRKTAPELFSHRRMTTAGLECLDQSGVIRTTTSMPLERALTCRWGGLSASGQQGETGDRIHEFQYAQELMELLENRQVFLYPSFASLELSDFCGFGHLPVYPLGMMSAYALNADGRMHTPLKFLIHDASHTCLNRTWKYLDGRGPLESIKSRLLFQQLVRSRMPAVLKEEHQVERAVELVLFDVLHEQTVRAAQVTLEKNSFLSLFQSNCRIRRSRHQDYSQTYRAVTDRQALLACAWVHWVYTRLRMGKGASGVLPDEQVSRFIRQDLPVLLEHQRFIDRHREPLHAYLRSIACVDTGRHGSQTFGYQKPGTSSTWDRLVLENTHDQEAGGEVRFTDLVYLEVLQSDVETARMQAALGVQVPPGRFHPPASPATC
ncbi:MAG: hypothetical protein OXC07_10920, partial [Kistimonas sp.]|nr:hypothetical protein [Kistimonas sp.]